MDKIEIYKCVDCGLLQVPPPHHTKNCAVCYGELDQVVASVTIPNLKDDGQSPRLDRLSLLAFLYFINFSAGLTEEAFNRRLAEMNLEQARLALKALRRGHCWEGAFDIALSFAEAELDNAWQWQKEKAPKEEKLKGCPLANLHGKPTAPYL